MWFSGSFTFYFIQKLHEIGVDQKFIQSNQTEILNTYFIVHVSLTCAQYKNEHTEVHFIPDFQYSEALVEKQ